MPSEASNKLFRLLDQLDGEVASAREGSDQQPLAILDLLYGVRSAASRNPAAQAVLPSAKQAVEFMVSVVESGQGFTLAQISQLKSILHELLRLSGHPAAPVAPAPPAVPNVQTHSPEEPLLMNIASDGDILKELVIEFQEHLDHIEQGVLVLERAPADKETLNTVFRAFHSFKGGAGFLNLLPINRLAHELESLLDLARNDKLQIDPASIDLILQGADLLKQFVAEMHAQLSGAKNPAPFTLPTEPLKAKLRSLISTPSATYPPSQAPPSQSPTHPAAHPPATSVIPPPPPSPAPSLSATFTLPAAPGSPPSTPVPTPTPPPAPAPDKPKAQAATPAASVKIDTQKLDALVDLVGELVIAQSFVAQHPEIKAITNQFFTRSLSQLGRITKELQRTAMSMRMVPISGAFQKMLRVVRDLAAKQNKHIRLLLSGEDTELDRTIVEDISDPLMHMVRNSIDHGIEPPEIRLARGKPAEGSIQLRAFHQGGTIVIQIQDDGNGLNRERILAKGIEKGLVSPSHELTDPEIFQLIFAPGFSTADVITDISGRGVGMDVVHRNIEKLHGKIEIESEEGKGSLFSIFLPLTLAIIDALVVRVGSQRFIIPALAVRESFQLAPHMISTVYNRGEMVKVRDRLIPLLRLGEHFNIQPRQSSSQQGIGIVLEAGRSTRCVLVDQLLHKQEVVIKSLGDTLKENRSLAGAAILGDGLVGLILDVNTLVQLKPTPVSIAA